MKFRFTRCILSAVILFGLGSAVLAQEETLTNSEVISLTKAGLSQSLIIGKIRTSKSSFDLSTNGLISLKQAGVSDEIVTVMMEAKSGRSVNARATAEAGDPNDPMAKHSYGIYLYEEAGGERRMTQVKPTVSAQNRTGGTFTSGLTYGISKVKTKANLPGRNSALQVQQLAPVFYFYLDASTGGLNTASGIPSDPKEFTLIRFNQRSDNREVTIGKSNAFGSKGGLSDEYVVPFTTTDLGNGTFEITPSGNLKPGEYAFYLVNSGNSNASAAIGAKFFDFGVSMIP